MARTLIIHFNVKCKHGHQHATRSEFESWDQFEDFRKDLEKEGFTVTAFRELSKKEVREAVQVVHVLVVSDKERDAREIAVWDSLARQADALAHIFSGEMPGNGTKH